MLSVRAIKLKWNACFAIFSWYFTLLAKWRKRLNLKEWDRWGEGHHPSKAPGTQSFGFVALLPLPPPWASKPGSRWYRCQGLGCWKTGSECPGDGLERSHGHFSAPRGIPTLPLLTQSMFPHFQRVEGVCQLPLFPSAWTCALILQTLWGWLTSKPISQAFLCIPGNPWW